MIRGHVLPSGEAVVTLKVRGPAGQIANVEAAVDTGFNDQLTLPPWVIEKLELEFRDEGDYILADGGSSAVRLFEAQVEWHGRWRDAIVVEIENDSLLGMAMMSDCNLNVDVVAGGKVEIQPLASGS